MNLAACDNFCVVQIKVPPHKVGVQILTISYYRLNLYHNYFCFQVYELTKVFKENKNICINIGFFSNEVFLYINIYRVVQKKVYDVI